MSMRTNIGIAGLGLIGGSLARAFKKFSSVSITAFDREDVLHSALSQKVIDKSASSIDELAGCDIIFLSLPVNESLHAMKLLSQQIGPNTIITDVCGVKEPFDRLWMSLDSKGKFIGGHPMTGKEKSGFENSDALLFENAVYILTHHLETDSKLISLLNEIGCKIKFLSSSVHDKIVASVSHLPQLAAVALIESLTTNDDYNPLDFAAGGFRDMTRIASSNYEIWQDILELNNQQIIVSIDEFILKLNELKKNVLLKNHDALKNIFRSASEKRNNIPFNNKGFINPLFDLFVFVDDKPGVLSRLTTLLFTAGINIKDIELLKIRDGSAGTFKISFESENDLQSAKSILSSKGFAINEPMK